MKSIQDKKSTPHKNEISTGKKQHHTKMKSVQDKINTTQK